jgi:uncharacterized protein (DUF305 family)
MKPGPVFRVSFLGPLVTRGRLGIPPPNGAHPVSIRWSMIFTLLPLLGACATTGGGEPSPATRSGTASLSPQEVEAIYRARIEEARTRYTGADIHFMTGMIHHHAQAIEMSHLAPSRGATGSVQTLASRIINAQQDEIATMQRWLRDRGQPVPELHETATGGIMVHGGSHEHMHDMPGMISPEQLRQLRESRGETFDRLFLTFMIEHHRGAVTMVQTLFATDGAGQDEEVFRFASDVQVDQATEVARMELMLRALPSGEGAR